MLAGKRLEGGENVQFFILFSLLSKVQNLKSPMLSHYNHARKLNNRHLYWREKK
jgi:hypothetical protein